MSLQVAYISPGCKVVPQQDNKLRNLTLFHWISMMLEINKRRGKQQQLLSDWESPDWDKKKIPDCLIVTAFMKFDLKNCLKKPWKISRTYYLKKWWRQIIWIWKAPWWLLTLLIAYLKSSFNPLAMYKVRIYFVRVYSVNFHSCDHYL